MTPKYFWIFKFFEKNLQKADSNNPCADRNYTNYKYTPTHGIWPIKMTLDLYSKKQDS